MNKENLSKLRVLMSKNKIDAYLTVSTDPHQSEYLPPYWQRNKFLAGFTGVYCRTIVTKNKAMLWTDGKEDLKVKKELKNSEFKYTVKPLVTADLDNEIEWIASEFKNGGIIGVDPKIMTVLQMDSLKETVSKQKGLSIKFTEQNLIDLIWKKRPSRPKSPITIRDKKVEPITIKQKLDIVAKELKDLRCDLHVVSNLESIARVLNARASDIEYNPLVISYLVLGVKESYWFVDKKRISKKYFALLPKNLKIFSYDDFGKKLNEISKDKTVLIDNAEASQWILNCINKSAKTKNQTSPVAKLKAIKTPAEIEMILNACLRDSLYLAQTIHWIKNEVKKRPVSESEMADKIIEFKSKDKTYIELSFEAIAAYDKNAAIIHYEPKTLVSCANIKNKGVLLIDCGAHFEDGTTDVTRTIAVGKCSKEEKQNYTRVLRGHLSLNMQKFPAGTRGYHLDAMARQYLWNDGLNYSHGTGHGVGYATCVHETAGFGITPLRGMFIEEGMVFTNEPGYYKENHYGIRIENMVYVEKDKTLSAKSIKPFLKLEQMTFCPYERELIDKNMLDKEEVIWINNYHKIVLAKLSKITKDKIILAWLKKACAPLI